jgi:hypothetical protein
MLDCKLDNALDIERKRYLVATRHILDKLLVLVEQATRQVLDMTDRCQLNLRLDGRRDLFETIQEVAAAEGLSLNAWIIQTLEQATVNPIPKFEGTRPTPAVTDIKPLLDTMLDNKLVAKLASFEE